MVKHLPVMQQSQVQSLGWEDPLEKGMATHSSILAWRIPFTEEPGRLQSKGSKRVRYNQATNSFFHVLTTTEKEAQCLEDLFGFWKQCTPILGKTAPAHPPGYVKDCSCYTGSKVKRGSTTRLIVHLGSYDPIQCPQGAEIRKQERSQVNNLSFYFKKPRNMREN